MQDFDYEIKKVIGLTCPNKYILKINNEEICFANSEKSLAKVLEFAHSLDESKIENGKVKKRIKEVLKIN